jgi:hypothetical protein
LTFLYSVFRRIAAIFSELNNIFSIIPGHGNTIIMWYNFIYGNVRRQQQKIALFGPAIITHYYQLSGFSREYTHTGSFIGTVKVFKRKYHRTIPLMGFADWSKTDWSKRDWLKP